MSSRGSGLDHRGREREHPADEDHRRPRDPAIRLLDGQHAQRATRRTRRAGRPRPAGTAPVASSTTITASTAIVRFAPAPSGTAWRRTSSGRSTTSTSGSSRFSSSASHVPCRRIVSPDREDVLARPVLALALDGEHDEIAAVGDHPGEDGLADQPGARRDDDLGDARERGSGACPPRHRSRTASTSVRA